MSQWTTNTDSGLDALNKHLEANSYIDGFALPFLISN